MKTVTFAELKPGMLIYPLADVNTPEEKFLPLYKLVMSTVNANTSEFWGDRCALQYISGDSPWHGAYWIPQAPTKTWGLIEEKDEIERVLNFFKDDLALHVGHLNECVELINGCL